MIQLVCFSLKKSMKPRNEKLRILSAANTMMSSSTLHSLIARRRSFTAPRRVSFVDVPLSIILICLFMLPHSFFAQFSKICANLWFVTIMCSSIFGNLSSSAKILPSIVLLPIFSSGFGKFSVKGYRRVAYLAAIIMFFIMRSGLNKSCTIVRLADESFECLLVLWELGEVFFYHTLFDGLCLRCVDDCDASTFEACA